MSNIVKSVAVVDDRFDVNKGFNSRFEELRGNAAVIKGHVFSYRKNPYEDQTLIMPNKQGYLDELNRIKVEIAQAKEELRKLGHMLDGSGVEEEAEAAGGLFEPEGDAIDHEALQNYLLAAQNEAQRMLQETKENIDIMMRGAEEEGRRMAEEAKSNGYLEGFDQGFNQAITEFKAAHEPQVQELEGLLEQISSYREEQLALNERDLTSLAITVAQKIIGQEIKSDQRIVANMLYQTLDANRREENIRITLSPDLFPIEAKVCAEVKKLIAQTAPGAIINVDEDAESGFVKVETDKGITDLSVSTQLDNIVKMLADG